MNYQTIIFELISIQKWDGVEDILRKKIDPDIRDSAGNYLIHLLIYNNQLKLLQLLLKLDPRIDILDQEGKQICYLPIRYNQINILKLLLEYNQINYGIDITNFRDSEQLSPLFYAIKFNSIECTELLLKYGARLNTFNQNRNSVLHLACQMGLYNFAKLYINYYPEIIKLINAEKQTILHTSILSNNVKLIKFILNQDDNKYLLNTQDINDRTPLMYAIEFQYNSIIQELIDTSMNLQDANGNTHYHLALKFNIDLDDVKFPEIKDKLIATKTDIDGNTILHLLLLKNKRYYFPDILKVSSFLIQNNDNNTALHLLLQHDWKKYTDILEKQKLSIFLKNKLGVSPYDIMNRNKIYNLFLPIIIESYYNQLIKNSNKEFITEWETKCSTNKLNKNECINKIKENINNGISYPQKKKTYCIDIKKKDVTNSTYLGITIDIISGLLLLKQLIKKETFDTSLNIDNIITNTKLNEFYISNRIIRNDLLNFEIIWSYRTIFFPENLDQIFISFIKSKNRYFIIPIGIELSQGSHANMLIFDKKFNLLERFEPDGSNPPNDFNYFPEELDSSIYQYFNKLIYSDMNYITPHEGSPRISFQRYESLESFVKISDPRGYCGAWCSWYTYQRVNSGLPMKKLIPKLLQKIRGNNLSFKEVIRNYANLMSSVRDKLFKKSNIEIEDWFSLLSSEKLNELTLSIKNYN